MGTQCPWGLGPGNTASVGRYELPDMAEPGPVS